MRGEVPAVDLTLGRPLWGFEQRVDAAAGEQVIVRVAPRLTAATAERPLAGLRIMLDAGHGGGDSGAVGPSGLMEKDANLVQAAWLERELAARGATVVQTRSDDVSVGLDDRVWLASGAEIDMFISLHHNSLGGDRTRCRTGGRSRFTITPTAGRWRSGSRRAWWSWRRRNRRYG